MTSQCTDNSLIERPTEFSSLLPLSLCPLISVVRLVNGSCHAVVPCVVTVFHFVAIFKKESTSLDCTVLERDGSYCRPTVVNLRQLN